MKVSLLILLLIVGADGYRKKRKTVQQNKENAVEATTDGRAVCTDSKYTEEKTGDCMDWITDQKLCSGPCEKCCAPPKITVNKIVAKVYDPCEEKNVGDVCYLNEDDIPAIENPKSFLQQGQEAEEGDETEEEAEDGDESEQDVEDADETDAGWRGRRRRRRRRAPRVQVAKSWASTDCATVPLDKNKWNHPMFAQCGFWGDPHFTKSFFANRRFDYQGIGVFQLASSKDKSFEIQSFQCSFAHRRTASVAVGFAVKMDGKITFISRKSESFVSDDKCFRFDVRSRHTGRSPGFYHDMSLAMKSDLTSTEGMCGHPAPHNEVPCGAEHLFTQEQIAEMCNSCTDPKPRDCIETCVKPTPAPPPTPSPPPPCGTELRDAQKACCALEDQAAFDACVMDFCTAGKDSGQEMADDAVNEVLHQVHTCQLEETKVMCKPKPTPPPTGRCHEMGFQ